MDVSNDSPSFYTPFSPQSTVLFSSTTHSGKTFLLLDIFKNRNKFFIGIKEDPVTELLVILCNNLVSAVPWQSIEEEDFKVEAIYQDEFEPLEHLKKNQLVVFDDVTRLTENIAKTLNIYTHHIGLKSCFVIVQSAITSEHFKNLLTLVHSFVINFGGTAATNISRHLKRNFFAGADLKAKFFRAVTDAEHKRTVLLLELNQIVTSNEDETTKFQIIRNLANFMNMSVRSRRSPVIVSPKASMKKKYERKFGDNEVDIASDDSDIDASELPDVDPDDDDYVLVKVSKVKRTHSSRHHAAEGSEESKMKKIWDEMNENIQDYINQLKVNLRNSARGLAKFMLNSKEFKVSADGKEVWLKSMSKRNAVSLLDFLHVASRMSGPTEVPNVTYVKFVKALLKKKTPAFMFKNKALLGAADGSRPPPPSQPASRKRSRRDSGYDSYDDDDDDDDFYAKRKKV